MGAIVPQAGIVSGILSTAKGVLTVIDGMEKTTPLPDPYVNQVGDLLSNNSNRAAQAAIKFNDDSTKEHGELLRRNLQ